MFPEEVVAEKIANQDKAWQDKKTAAAKREAQRRGQRMAHTHQDPQQNAVPSAPSKRKRGQAKAKPRK